VAPPAIRYHFGTGTGPVHRHASRADADLGPGGAPDAVLLDFDGDGRVDDALWDADADGVADRAVLDLDDDGRPERGFTDPSGRGVWDAPAAAPGAVDTGAGAGPDGLVAGGGRRFRWTDVRGVEADALAARDTDGDGTADAAVVEADHDPATTELVGDPDADGRAEVLLVDHDADGRAESAYTSSADPPGGPASRWDVLLADTDADASADAVLAEGAAGWVPP